MGRLRITLIALCVLGCSNDSAHEGESAATSGDESREHTEGQPAVVAVTLPPGPVAPVEGQRIEQDVAVEADVEANANESLVDADLERLAAVIAAAQNTGGGTYCEQAYNGAMAMVAALSQQSGQAPSANIPSRSSFLSGCNGLSVQAQRCMTMSYAMANQATCSTVMQSAEVQAFRNQMRRP
ncbi:MAG: hypothetical protein AB8H86_33560 [Polyangiales bacterium]